MTGIAGPAHGTYWAVQVVPFGSPRSPEPNRTRPDPAPTRKQT